MKSKSSIVSIVVGFLIIFSFSSSSQAIELNWSGSLRTESHILFNPGQDGTTVGLLPDASRLNRGGYYIPGTGDPNAFFQTLFMRLKPSVVVNDNVYLYSEIWASDPVYGFYGGAAPGTFDQRQFNSTFSSGSFIRAQRFWAEVVTDLGTIKVGRVPLQWGLGVVWNPGSGLWDKYNSTGDTFGIKSKFGSFTITPQIIKYSMGNSVQGSCTVPTGGGSCTNAVGNSNSGDLSIALEYENLDEDAKVGVNFIRRFTDSAQDPSVGFFGVNSTSNLVSAATFNVIDIFAKKKFNKLSIGAEAPITSGNVGGASYNTFAAAAEIGYQPSSSWEFTLKGGRAPGTNNVAADATGAFPSSGVNYSAFYFHQNYKIAMIMFNYAFQNFGQANNTNSSNTLGSNMRSPFDNPIVNANYAAITGQMKTDRWNFHSTFALASAATTAGTGYFFNYWDHKYYAYGAGTQGSLIGWEMDYGATLKWDDNFELGLDMGFYFPGNYYTFSNTATDNKSNMVFGTLFKAGMSF